MTFPAIKNRVVVSCAGSGKTRQLIARLLALLKAGAQPGEILALTFTKKAAAEIRSRLLAEMAAVPELAVCRRRILLAAEPRDIFAAHTFHSWFLSMVRNRPWAGVHAPSPVEERQKAKIFEEAWRRWRRRAEREMPPPLAALLAELTPLSLRKLCEEFNKNRNVWILRQHAPPPPFFDYAAACREQLGATQTAAQDFAAVGKDAADGKVFCRARDAAARIAAGETTPPDEAKNFFTAAGAPLKTLQTAAEKCNGGAPLAKLLSAMEELLRLEDGRRAEEFNAAAHAVYADFDAEWENVLAARNEITFDGLELAAHSMLQNEKTRDTLSRRLYIRYRHVLIDEFQDTGPLQWQIMRSFLWDAHGADDSPTVFIVGDPKQAIYGFRHGDSRLLGEAEKFLAEYYGVKKEPPQNICRRCAKNILEFVNAAFDGRMPGFVRHMPGETNAKMKGRVEWRPYFADKPPRPKGVRAPLTTPPVAAEKTQERRAAAVAEKIAEILREWKIGGGADARRCRPEDIMILSPQMTHAAAQTDALAAKNIACAVSGGGQNFLESFECADILDLAAALLSPGRDYSLARALKSPLFLLDDDLLSELADGTGAPLWDKLQTYSGGNAAARRARILLKLWRRRAQTSLLPAHDFLSRILAQGNAAARYQAAVPDALKNRVRENLARLLDFSLQAEGGARPLLAQFLESAKNGAAPPPASGGVRLMSIHAAKGLQSPVVVIADCDFSHSGARGNSADILSDWPPDAAAPAQFAAVPRRRRMAYLELKYLAEERKKREQANLLYVAMTRAEQALVIFSPAEPKNAAAWPLAAMQQLSPQNNPEIPAVFGDNLRAAAEPKNPPPAAAAKTEPLGWREIYTAAAVHGEIRHKILALLLSGIPMQTARRFAAAEPAQWREAEKIAAAPALQKILKNAQEVLVEREFAVQQKIIRPDLVVIREDGGEKTAWIIDYKTAARPEKYREQLEKYRRAVAARYPEHKTRTAILDIRGKMHFLDNAE
ncbi:MAG: UvrD-helicase domain-containing protein [Betaproteobacteria bacterium]|nr:UvrD-helicase domain-containing protein [Betaproteobacteria bacterium]